MYILTDTLSLSPSPACQCVCVLGCGPHYEYAMEEFCLARFRLDMLEVEQSHWCHWEETLE